ncbi:MAG: hypothetical protein NTV70_01745 [Acidobacteria bacterium]|nr:hypothetical protein [Acidobacteriota bacterium]
MTVNAEKLESWKQIAGYLDRDIKTVQRWEHQEGLPIHRLLHTGHASVFAWRTELDAWMQSRQQGPEPLRSNSQLFTTDRILFVVVTSALAIALAVHILQSP